MARPQGRAGAAQDEGRHAAQWPFRQEAKSRKQAIAIGLSEARRKVASRGRASRPHRSGAQAKAAFVSYLAKLITRRTGISRYDRVRFFRCGCRVLRNTRQAPRGCRLLRGYWQSAVGRGLRGDAPTIPTSTRGVQPRQASR
jgi:hypothetical protein